MASKQSDVTLNHPGSATNERDPSPARGWVRILLVVWTLVLIAAAIVWWQMDSGPSLPPPPPRAATAEYTAIVEPHQGDRIAIRLQLDPGTAASSKRITLKGPRLRGQTTVQDARGHTVPCTVTSGQVVFDVGDTGDDRANGNAGPYTVRYEVPVGEIRDSVRTSICTPSGGGARLSDLLLLPERPTALRFRAELPPGWFLLRAKGMDFNGQLDRSAVEQGAVAWTHSARQSLVSRPHDVDTFFLGRPGLGDRLLPTLRDLVRELLRDLVVGPPLRYRLLFVDLEAPHHRLVLPPQGSWHMLERGPATVHRMVRIVQGFLYDRVPHESATPAGPDRVWYPGALHHYGAYLLTDKLGIRPPVDWLNIWRVLEQEYLWERKQRNGPRASALKASMVLHDLARTHANATSLRLLSEPARNRSLRPNFPFAFADQMNVVDTGLFTRARGSSIYLDLESPWRLPVLYEKPRPPTSVQNPTNLRLLLTAETFAEVMGCTGCPAPGTMGQRVERLRQRSQEGIPTLVVDAGDWTPFFLETPSRGAAFDARIAVARRAAHRSGVAALVVGPGEIGWGAAVLSGLLQKTADVPVISANVQLKDGTRPPAFVSRRVGEWTVAIVGITDLPRTRFRLSWVEEALQTIQVEEPVAAAQRAARQAREAGADLVVVVGALDPVHARLLAANPGEVDLVVSSSPGLDRPPAPGSTLQTFTRLDQSGFFGAVPVLYTSGHRGGQQRVDLTLSRDPEGRLRVVDFSSTPERLEKNDPADPEVHRLEVDFNQRFPDGK